jgi:hypothetical protein
MTVTDRPTHYIKVRQSGERSWKFLASGGHETRLRIHANQFTEENARKAVEQLTADNPGFEFKMQPI